MEHYHRLHSCDKASIYRSRGRRLFKISWDLPIQTTHNTSRRHESEEKKQQKAIIQEKLNNAELNVDDEKLELGSPLDYYDGEPILLTTLKELEKEEKDAQKGQ
ncbi:hypothetical protein KC349_g9182 [Hortaea werneckii]|nr:hypothetical protein KC349_g9182 [Hortaea werneckii]